MGQGNVFPAPTDRPRASLSRRLCTVLEASLSRWSARGSASRLAVPRRPGATAPLALACLQRVVVLVGDHVGHLAGVDEHARPCADQGHEPAGDRAAIRAEVVAGEVERSLDLEAVTGA